MLVKLKQKKYKYIYIISEDIYISIRINDGKNFENNFYFLGFQYHQDMRDFVDN
jgi:hypothetical protein